MTAFPSGYSDFASVSGTTKFFGDDGSANGLGSAAQIAEYIRTLTQTLTNKTLTDPTLGGTGTITGIGAGFSKVVLDDANGAAMKYGTAAIFNTGTMLFKSGATTVFTCTTAGNLTLAGGLTTGSTTLHTTSVALTNGAAANTATLTNAPVAGNPTKWVPINDNGTTRYIPAW